MSTNILMYMYHVSNRVTGLFVIFCYHHLILINKFKCLKCTLTIIVFVFKSLSVLCLHFRYHRVGVLVIFLHDVNDIFLEFSKLCLGFKSRGGKYHIIPDILSIMGFLSFASLW